MSDRERGSEIVQFVIAVPLVLLVLFAVVQTGAMMLSVNRLTADLTRACRQMDTAGLSLAADKEAFVAGELLGFATQLRPEQLHVSGVVLEAREDGRSSDPAQAGAAVGGMGDGFSSVAQRSDVAQMSFDVAYELPALAALPGLEHQTISRHVLCMRVEGRIVEVEVSP